VSKCVSQSVHKSRHSHNQACQTVGQSFQSARAISQSVSHIQSVQSSRVQSFIQSVQSVHLFSSQSVTQSVRQPVSPQVGNLDANTPKKVFYPSRVFQRTLSARFALLNLLILSQETQGHKHKNHAPDPPDSVTEFARTVTRDTVMVCALRSSATQAGQFGQFVQSVQSVQSVIQSVCQSVNQSVQSIPVQSNPVQSVSPPGQSVSQSSQFSPPVSQSGGLSCQSVRLSVNQSASPVSQ
jgi:hypothetical protein